MDNDEFLNNLLSNLPPEAEHVEQQLNNLAGYLYIQYHAFVSSGFNEEQAFDLAKATYLALLSNSLNKG